MNIHKCIQSDGRIVNAAYNVWIDTFRQITFLHILDYIPVSSGIAQYSYNIFLASANPRPPQFKQTFYYANITEESIHNNFTSVAVVKSDPAQKIVYKLSDASLPFSIDLVTGFLSTASILDREQQDSYSLVVLAIDDNDPPLTGTAAVLVTVLDINDNKPIFSNNVLTDVSIDAKASIGYILTKVSATDADIGLNGMVQLTLIDTSNLFTLNTVNGTLEVKASLLQAIGDYTIIVLATDEGTPPQVNNITIVIHVRKVDLYKPQFGLNQFVFQISETNKTGVIVGQLNATDMDDPLEILHYKLTSSVPFSIDETTGVITNILPLDRETIDQYTFEVLVVDSGAPLSGPLTGSANVTVQILDVNDNYPMFSQLSYDIHIPENVLNVTTLLKVKATDRDLGNNGTIVAYYLFQLIPPSLKIDKFNLSTVDGQAVLSCIKPLDRETQDHYLLMLEAVDGGQPPLATNVSITISVDDVNDNAPVFQNISANITISRSTAVNTIIYTIIATDADTGLNGNYLSFFQFHF